MCGCSEILMKRCPQCNHVEPDNSLAFCRVDGAALISDSDSGTKFDSSPVSSEIATSLLPHSSTAPDRSTGPTTVLPQTHPGARTRELTKSKSRVVIGLALLLAVVVAVGGYFYFTRARNTTIDSIAVLPFENKSSDADTEYLSDGLAESLIYRLSQLPNLKVSPTSMVLRYKGSQTDAVKVGNDLGVSAVLLGRITQRGDSLMISAELVDARNNQLLWGEQYDRKMSDLLMTQREIAREIAETLKLKVSGEERGLTKSYTESNEAYQLYLRGRFYWTKRTEPGLRKSLEYFQQALDKDGNFALAYSGLADAYILLAAQDAAAGMPPEEALPKARAAAVKALSIDNSLAEPHTSLAHILYYYDRDGQGAEREYKRAIELNPNYPTGHSWYAVFLMSWGRSEEALKHIKKAQELEPLSLPINMTVGWVLLNARQYDQAVEQLRKTLELDPNFILAHHRLGIAYELLGKYDEASAEYAQVIKLSEGRPIGLAALARVYALKGQRAEAHKALFELQGDLKQRYVSPASIAMVYSALGDRDSAFVWLEKAYKEKDGLLARLKVDPRFDSLRSDPRFQELERRVYQTR